MRVEYREEPCASALSHARGMPFAWTLNPYTGCVHRCTFCYVRAFERRADRPAGEDYGRTIRVKINVADVLRRQVTRRSWRGEAVAIGTATDPYQPAEGRYRLTRACIEVLTAAANPFDLVTRGPLVVRDVDLLAEASRCARVSVSLSIPTLDEDVWRATEPDTAPPHQRLRALTRLRDAGIDAGVAIAPVLPGLSDQPDQLAAVVEAARDAGATYVWASVVNLRPGTREHFIRHLAAFRPQLVPFYERLYAARVYPPRSTEQRVRAVVAGVRRELQFSRVSVPKPDRAPVQLRLLQDA